MFSPAQVFAQFGPPPANAPGVNLNNTTLGGIFKISNFGAVVTSGITLAFILAAILVFVFLIWGGIQWMTSGGDKAKTEEARNRITAALVGLAIIAVAWAIMQLLAYFFGFSVTDINVPKPW